jgi:hypothetical protein
MTENLDLQSYNIVRPEKVTWIFPPTHDVLASIKSKSLRSFLKRGEALMQEQGIRWEYRPLSEQDFFDWLPYYEEKMKENGFDILANKNTYQEKIAAGSTVEGLFFYRNQKMIGSIILTRKGNEYVALNFKASDKLDIFPGGRSSIGALIDYIFLKVMSEQEIKLITGGSSRNAFGVINKIGYLDSRLRTGFEVIQKEDVAFLDFVPLAADRSVLFFGMRDGGPLTLFGVKPKDSAIQFEQARFASASLPFEEILI